MPFSPGAFAESRTQAIFFSKEDFEEFSPTFCRVYFLTDREIALIVSCLRYADWESRWQNRDKDEQLVEELHGKLMDSCEELTQIRIQLTRLANAAFGMPDTAQVASLEGLDNPIVDNQETSVGASLMSLVGTGEEQDYTDELVEIAGDLVAIAAIL